MTGLILAIVALGLVFALFFWGHDKEPSAKELEEIVVTCGDISLDNTQLGYYFWSEYSYYLMSLDGQVPGTLDVSLPLADQMYDETQTWQDFILGKTKDTMADTLAMVNGANRAGFTLPEPTELSLQSILEEIQTKALTLGLVLEDGSPDIQSYLQASFGPGANLENLEIYLRQSYLAAAYSDYLYETPEFTAQEVEDYFDQNGGAYYDQGIEKTDTPLATVRTVVVKPTSQDQADWDKAKLAAENLLTTWLAEGGNESDFSAMAAAHSQDLETKGNGGLLANIDQEDVDDLLASWIFSEDRAPGDTAVLQSDEGWVLVYYVEQNSFAQWQVLAQADLRQEKYLEVYDQLLLDFPMEIKENHVILMEIEGYVTTK